MKRLVTILTWIVASGCAGHSNYAAGKRHMANGEYRQALDKFERAQRQEPVRISYSRAAASARKAITNDALARIQKVPEADVPTRLTILREAMRFDDSGRLAKFYASISGWLSGAVSDAAALEAFAESDPPRAAAGIAHLWPYSPYVSEIAAGIRVALPTTVRALQADVTNTTAERHAIIARLAEVTQLPEAVALSRDAETYVPRSTQVLTEAERKRQSEQARALLSIGGAAEAGGAIGIAWDATEMAATLDPSPELRLRAARLASTLKSELSSETRIVLDASLGPELAQRIEAGVPAPLRTMVAATPDSSGSLRIHLKLADFQWSVRETGSENVWSKFRSGTSQVANPNYAIAQANYQQALAGYSSGGFQGWAAVAAAAIVRQRRDELNRMPPFFDEPVYQSYQFVRRTLREVGRVEIQVSTTDLETGVEAVAGPVLETSDRTIVEIIGAHPYDERGAINSSYSDEESLRSQASLKEATCVRASRVISSHVLRALRDRATELDAIGAPREAIDAQLRYGNALGQLPAFAAENPIEVRASARARYSAKLPPAAAKKIAAARSTRTKNAAKSSTAVAVGSSARFLTKEEVVRCAIGSLVRVRTAVGEGSAFLVDKAGLVLTNAHVVEGARDIALTTSDGSQSLASVVIADRRRDIAVLRISTKLSGLTIRRTDSEVGESVLAFGAPEGLGETVTQGIISARRKLKSLFADGSTSSLSLDGELVLLQTDAAINPGNSGGPLVDMGCQVVGMNTWKRGDGEGLGFAISGSDLRAAVGRAKKKLESR